MDTRLRPVRHEMTEEADANLLSLIKTRGCGEGGRTSNGPEWRTFLEDHPDTREHRWFLCQRPKGQSG
jgi:hypothetical protein